MAPAESGNIDELENVVCAFNPRQWDKFFTTLRTTTTKPGDWKAALTVTVREKHPDNVAVSVSEQEISLVLQKMISTMHADYKELDEAYKKALKVGAKLVEDPDIVEQINKRMELMWIAVAEFAEGPKMHDHVNAVAAELTRVYALTRRIERAISRTEDEKDRAADARSYP